MIQYSQLAISFIALGVGFAIFMDLISIWISDGGRVRSGGVLGVHDAGRVRRSFRSW